MLTNNKHYHLYTTDQIRNIYTYWKTGVHKERVVFDIFNRKNPFDGNFTIFAGLDEVLDFIQQFHFDKETVDSFKKNMIGYDPTFFDWLESVDLSEVNIHSVSDGEIIFSQTPVITIEGPLAICKLITSQIKMLITYPTHIATGSIHMKMTAGDKIQLIESGVRRALSNELGLQATKYSYMAGFDTSTNPAGVWYNIPNQSLHDHEFILMYNSFSNIKDTTIMTSDGARVEFLEKVVKFRKELGYTESNEGELAAFIVSAQAMPDNFIAMVDTYSILDSGMKNFACVALALNEVGYKAKGVHIDEGDLVEEVDSVRGFLNNLSANYSLEYVKDISILVSNDIDIEYINKFKKHKSSVDGFVVASNLVDPRYNSRWEYFCKIVHRESNINIRLSNNPDKRVLLGSKRLYRFFDINQNPVRDGLLRADESLNDLTDIGVDTYDNAIPLYSCIWDGKTHYSNSESLDNRRKNILTKAKYFWDKIVEKKETYKVIKSSNLTNGQL